jgi:Rod binding domain-containing protein
MGSSASFGPLAAQAQTSMLQTRENSMIGQLNSLQGSGSKDDAKIDKSAQDFESMLLSTWLQQAEQSMGSVQGAEDDDDAGQRDQMMSLGVQALSTSLAASGGIGIGKMIAKALHATADRQNAAAEAAAAAEGKKIEK